MVIDMRENDIAKKLKTKFTRDNFLIIVLIGVLLMVIIWPVEDSKKNKEVKSGQWDSEDVILNQQSDKLQNAAVSRSADSEEDVLLSYASKLESALEQLLCTVDGVGKVRVMVTLESSGEAIIEKDASTVRDGTTEVDSAGGSRNTTNISDSEKTVYRNDQGNSEIPYVKKILAPKVAGVVVSAQGGGNAKTVQNITEAIQALFGIEAHKIKVVKMISQ